MTRRARTIRDQLRRRLRWMAVLLFALIISTIVLLFATSLLASSLPTIALAIASVGIFTLLLGWIILRCPRCRESLFNGIAVAAVGKGRRRANFCPYCGVSFDETTKRQPVSIDGARSD